MRRSWRTHAARSRGAGYVRLDQLGHGGRTVRNTECGVKFHSSESLQVTRTAGQNAPAEDEVVKRIEQAEVSTAPRESRVSVGSIELAPCSPIFPVSWSIFDRSCASFTLIPLRMLLCLALASEISATPFQYGAARQEHMSVRLSSAGEKFGRKIFTDKTVEMIRESERLRIEQQQYHISGEVNTRQQ